MMHNKNHLSVMASLMIGLLCVFTSCKDEEEVRELVLSTTYLEMNTGEQITIQIESGNGDYSFTMPNEDIVSAEISDHTILLIARSIGQTVLTVTDQAAQSISLNVTVMLAGSELTSHFSWNNIWVKLEETNDWGYTFFPDRITVTSIPEKKQYLLSWQGGLSEGVKSNGVLKIVEENELTQTISLTRVSVVDLNPSYYTILFNKNNQTGEIIVAK